MPYQVATRAKLWLLEKKEIGLTFFLLLRWCQGSIASHKRTHLQGQWYLRCAVLGRAGTQREGAAHLPRGEGQSALASPLHQNTCWSCLPAKILHTQTEINAIKHVSFLNFSLPAVISNSNSPIAAEFPSFHVILLPFFSTGGPVWQLMSNYQQNSDYLLNLLKRQDEEKRTSTALPLHCKSKSEFVGSIKGNRPWSCNSTATCSVPGLFFFS